MSHLAEDYHRSIPWIRDKIFEYEPPEQTYNPSARGIGVSKLKITDVQKSIQNNIS